MAFVNRCIFNVTSGGTGSWTFLSAVSGYLSPASALVQDANTYGYSAEQRDAANNIVAWEIGTTTPSSSATVFTRTVIASSNANALVNFANPPQVLLTAVVSQLRETLLADRTYYVRSDGNDGNSGLANTAAAAYLTVQRPYSQVATIDFNGFNVTIQVGAGTFSSSGILVPVTVGQRDIQSLQLTGDNTTPSNVVIQAAGNQSYLFVINKNARCAFGGIKFTNGGFTVSTFISNVGGAVQINNPMEYGAADSHLTVEAEGLTQISANYTISGGGSFHAIAKTGGFTKYLGTQTVTLTGTPAFSARTYSAEDGGIMSVPSFWVTFSGAATGTRYLADMDSIIQTNGGGATFLPGNAAGSTSNGGQYA